MKNILLSHFILPPFSIIKYEHMIPAVNDITRNCRNVITNLIKKYSGKYTWENFCQPILELNEYLNRIISIINHLNCVTSTPELRLIHNQITQIITNYHLWFFHNKEIYNIYLIIQNNIIISNKIHFLQQTSIKNILRDFKLSGILLTYKDYQVYKYIIKKLSVLQITFNNNILDSTNDWQYYTTDKDTLKGIPKNIIESFKEKAAKYIQKKGYLITLEESIYINIMMYSTNHYLRKNIYYAYTTRASNIKNSKWDNFPIIIQELSLRYKLAQLLGYNTYAIKSIDNKSAKKVCHVLHFLKQLVQLIKIPAKKEVQDLKLFVKEKFNIVNIKPWDVMFFTEKYKSYLYNIDFNIIKSYFPINAVMDGMFNLLYKIYGLIFKKKIVDTWNNKVMFFNVYNTHHKLYGSIYFDLYTRPEKQNGAWMDIYQNRMLKQNSVLQYPIAYVNCNFIYTHKHILLNHYDVITLFHECGHALHHIMSVINIPNISGINAIPLDIVEFPSQFMEYWCWEPEIIALISQHYKSKQSMPMHMIKQLVATKKYNISLSMMKQIELSLLDIIIHNEKYDKINKEIILNLIKIIKKDIVTITPMPKWNKFLNSFSHIFGNEYAAGYYSYLWSEQIATDIFDYFKQNGLINPVIGKKFIKEILSTGNSENILKVFKKFRGRNINIQSLLKYKGISK
ncbi:oligopeptidase A [Enterobacteriaceae endosymbiont of Macroplea mutica]|uniref:M3 family metallopeptidase n=1 Tax=Enterobacteriaceae endosymbiont of Macroplea mutica TaxID=2675791 RepID=UPI00144A1460|nr:M3 family metallopeptidase [Enterobacteriaceae endosymbiont of Macroplea mutica]QJC31206.1 oligopeptidase A [Enterobacteriaceae endosymbiont of Macroplea mutica]